MNNRRQEIVKLEATPLCCGMSTGLGYFLHNLFDRRNIHREAPLGKQSDQPPVIIKTKLHQIFACMKH